MSLKPGACLYILGRCLVHVHVDQVYVEALCSPGTCLHSLVHVSIAQIIELLRHISELQYRDMNLRY
jgi:hypothetical protein